MAGPFQDERRDESELERQGELVPPVLSRSVLISGPDEEPADPEMPPHGPAPDGASDHTDHTEPGASVWFDEELDVDSTVRTESDPGWGGQLPRPGPESARPRRESLDRGIAARLEASARAVQPPIAPSSTTPGTIVTTDASGAVVRHPILALDDGDAPSHSGRSWRFGRARRGPVIRHAVLAGVGIGLAVVALIVFAPEGFRLTAGTVGSADTTDSKLIDNADRLDLRAPVSTQSDSRLGAGGAGSPDASLESSTTSSTEPSTSSSTSSSTTTEAPTTTTTEAPTTATSAATTTETTADPSTTDTTADPSTTETTTDTSTTAST